MEIKIVSEFKHINIKDGNTRKVLTPDMDINNETQQIKDLANQHWTQEVKDAWEAKKQLDKKIRYGI